MMNKIRKWRVMGGASVALFATALISCNSQNTAAKNSKGTVQSFLYEMQEGKGIVKYPQSQSHKQPGREI